MKLRCIRKSCKNTSKFQKDGFYFRKDDSKKIQRYRCKVCGARTSSAQTSRCYKQKKRTINPMIEKLLASKVTMNRIAVILKVNKNTVGKRLIFLGKNAIEYNEKERLKMNVEHIQFDDIITTEKTKLKPLSISFASDVKSRKILSAHVSRIPCGGTLAKLSKKKYGHRKNEHPKALRRMFKELKEVASPFSLIESDKHKFYPKYVKEFFPMARYKQHKGAKGAAKGQGELKKLKYDPLHSINHNAAMLRDGVSRLVRKTWCVTQKPERLLYHLNIYIKFHNSMLV